MSVAITFVAVVLAWVFFRAADLSTALSMLSAMAGANGLGKPAPSAMNDIDIFLLVARVPPIVVAWKAVLVYPLALFAVFALPNSQELVEPARFRAEGPVRLAWMPNAAWAAAMALVVSLSVLTFASASEFLYFQF
jgi:hypothetical protein